MTYPKLILKRDGTHMPFDVYKIRQAIYKANRTIPSETLSDARLDEVSRRVVEKIHSTIPGVEEIQDLVEETLIEEGALQTAKAYIIYRAQHHRRREAEDNLMKLYKEITFKGSEDNDLLRENANIDGDTSMGTMLKYGSEGSKYFVDQFILPEDMQKAHEEGRIHIHDKDFYMLTETCCQIDLIDLFERGFSTGHGFLRTPQSIGSYAALACIAVQANQNEMHGGQSIPHFDYAMEEGVNKSYRKALKSLIEYSFSFKELDLPEDMDQLIEGVTFVEEEEEKELLLELEEMGLSEVQRLSLLRKARKMIEKETLQAMQALIHNLNTMNSRAGAQVPFSSINYGTCTSSAGRLVMKSLLEATWDGLGGGETPIFPVQIFKVKEGINYNEEDPNYDLFRQALKVSAKRLFPNFSFLDAPFNLAYYKEGQYNSEVAYMGCRTRVMGNVVDPSKEVTCGRGNLSFTSINLPRLAIDARGDLEKFYEELEDTMELVFRQLLHRVSIQEKKKVKNYPFLMGQGVWIDSGELNQEEEIAEVLRHGTLSIGFIGLAETLVALRGKHHGESKESQELGLEIVGFMRKKCDEMSKRETRNVTLLATPAEGLSGRFVRLDKKKYGELPGITDQDFYTNSFHVPVYYPISAFEKIEKEAPYHNFTNAGHISYVELDGDLSKNLSAFESVIRKMKEEGVGYGSVNHPVDRDPVCGFTGIIHDVCPRCGRKDGESIPLEKLQELKKRYPDVPDYYLNKR